MRIDVCRRIDVFKAPLFQTPATPAIRLSHSRVQSLLRSVVDGFLAVLQREQTVPPNASIVLTPDEIWLNVTATVWLAAKMPKGLFEALQDASSMPDVVEAQPVVAAEPIQETEEPPGLISRLQAVLLKADPRAYVRLNPEDNKMLDALDGMRSTPWGNYHGLRVIRRSQPHKSQNFILDPKMPPGHCILGRQPQDTDGPLASLLTQGFEWIWKHGIEDRPLAMQSSAKLDTNAPWTVVDFHTWRIRHTNEVMPAEPACSGACSERSPCGVCRQRARSTQAWLDEKCRVSRLLDALESVKEFQYVLLHSDDVRLLRKFCSEDLDITAVRPPGNYSYCGKFRGLDIWENGSVHATKGRVVATHGSFTKPMQLLAAGTIWQCETKLDPAYPWVVVAYEVPGMHFFHRPFED